MAKFNLETLDGRILKEVIADLSKDPCDGCFFNGNPDEYCPENKGNLFCSKVDDIIYVIDEVRTNHKQRLERAKKYIIKKGYSKEDVGTLNVVASLMIEFSDLELKDKK